MFLSPRKNKEVFSTLPLLMIRFRKPFAGRLSLECKVDTPFFIKSYILVQGGCSSKLADPLPSNKFLIN